MTYRLLDLFCCQGGAGMGYHQAGFEVEGVDINPQPRYPFGFHKGDALGFTVDFCHEFDAIHASPPCQSHSSLRGRWGRDYEDFIPRIREILIASGKPWIIENVEGAPLVNPVTLCGTMFGLKVLRHRLFETNFGLTFPPATCQHERGIVGRRGHLGDKEFMTITGHFSNIEKARAAMGIDWMDQKGLAQAIPPAYTNFIGSQLIQYLEAQS